MMAEKHICAGEKLVFHEHQMPFFRATVLGDLVAYTKVVKVPIESDKKKGKK
jgi:hypothetical protein